MATKKATKKSAKKGTKKGAKKGASLTKKSAPTEPTAEPPITIKGGSVEIELDKSIFPEDGSNPKKHRNASRKLASLQITDLKNPATTLLEVDLDKLVKGKCMIIVRYK
jgi:hypothetical protein